MDTIYQAALNSEKPSQTLIMLHGLGVDGSDLEGLQADLARISELDNVKVILPTAPVRTITVMNLDMPAWFDMLSDDFIERPGEVYPEDIKGMNESVAIVQKIIDEERATNPDTPIWIGGFSQGAVIALLAGYSQTLPLAGILALSGYIPRHQRFDELSDIARSTPTFIGHGTLDTVIPIAKGRDGVSLLNEKGATVEFYEYPMMHEISPDEIVDLADFMVTHCDDTKQIKIGIYS